MSHFLKGFNIKYIVAAVFAVAVLSVGAMGTTYALTATGVLRWDGGWTSNNFTCDAGYIRLMYHYDCGCSNNSTWYACVPN